MKGDVSMKEETFHRRRTFHHCVVLCRPWMAGEVPMNITEINRNTGVKKITIKDKDGSTKGSITIRSSGIKKTKKLQYISRRISTQIISAKTSGNAREVMTRAKGETVRLRRKLVSGDYDRNEVRRAIIHAERMERIAKKRMKHLQEEEYIKKHGGSWQSKLEQEQEEEMQAATSPARACRQEPNFHPQHPCENQAWLHVPRPRAMTANPGGSLGLVNQPG